MAHLVGDGLVKLVCGQLIIVIGWVSDAILEFAVQKNKCREDVSGLGVQFAGTRKADDQWIESEGPKERAVGIENDRVLRAAVAGAQYSIEILNRFHIAAGGKARSRDFTCVRV